MGSKDKPQKKIRRKTISKTKDTEIKDLINERSGREKKNAKRKKNIVKNKKKIYALRERNRKEIMQKN